MKLGNICTSADLMVVEFCCNAKYIPLLTMYVCTIKWDTLTKEWQQLKQGFYFSATKNNLMKRHFSRKNPLSLSHNLI